MNNLGVIHQDFNSEGIFSHLFYGIN